MLRTERSLNSMQSKYDDFVSSKPGEAVKKLKESKTICGMEVKSHWSNYTHSRIRSPKRVIMLCILIVTVYASQVGAGEALMWGQGQWGVNTWSADADNDGIPDSEDAFPLDGGESADTDGDGIGNNADTDDDGDGVADSVDALPLDADETMDTDNDGIGNNADTDDDNDGYSDQHELEMGSDPLDSDDMPRSGGLSPALLRVISQGVIKGDDGG